MSRPAAGQASKGRGSPRPSALKLREKAYQSFTERLLAQDIRPGQFVSQRELVDITGMTLGAIRELIPRLEADGLIKTVPQRGMQVAHVDLSLIRNAFQFRLVLEREAVAHFAETATDEELETLHEAHAATLAEAGRGVTPELLRRAQQMDWDLHDLMIDRLGNEIISSAYRVNSIKIRLISFERVRMLPELVVSVMKEHLPIIEALQRRDAAAAVAALEAHVASARSRALRIQEDVGLPLSRPARCGPHFRLSSAGPLVAHIRNGRSDEGGATTEVTIGRLPPIPCAALQHAHDDEAELPVDGQPTGARHDAVKQ